MLEESSLELGLSLKDLFDRLSKEVAEGFLRGEYSWSFSDNAMNFIFGSWSRQAAVIDLPDLTHGIFLAFDAGETSANPEAETTALLKTQLDNGDA